MFKFRWSADFPQWGRYNAHATVFLLAVPMHQAGPNTHSARPQHDNGGAQNSTSLFSCRIYNFLTL